MGGGEQHHLLIVDARRLRRFLVDTRHRRRQFKELQHGRALRTTKAAVSAADIVGGNAPLLIGRACKGNEGRLPRNEVAHLHRVAYGVHIGSRGLHAVIDHDRPLLPKLQARFFCKGAVGRHADGENDHVGAEGFFVLQKGHNLSIFMDEALHAAAQAEGNAVAFQRLMELHCHIRIQGRHHLSGALDDGHIEAQLA